MIKKADIQLSAIKSAILFVIFLIYTDLVCLIDVEPIGPMRTKVGFAAINRFFINTIGVHAIFYTITDFLAAMSILVMLFFAGMGMYQLIERKSFKKIDIQLYAMAIFYVAMIAFYCVFEVVVINYRPILVNDVLEASYPSSHTMLVVCVISTALIEAKRLIKNKAVRNIIIIFGIFIILLAVVGRLFAGVHWFTDILGSLFLSGFLIYFYHTVSLILTYFKEKKKKESKISN